MPNGRPPYGENEEYHERHTDPFIELDRNAFFAAFGESMESFLDLNSWQSGEAMASTYERLDREVQESLKQENETREQIRKKLFPRAFHRKHAPRDAGLYQVTRDQLEYIHKGLLFNGSVEACDGMSVLHDSLSMTIAQMGVSLIAYNGNQGTWLQRLYRRDLRQKQPDPFEEVIQLLERRRLRSNNTESKQQDKLSDLSRRGLLYFGERATLLERSQALWRMGHGVPIPYELLTGSGLVINGDMPLLRHSMNVLDALLEKHRRWVFVSKKLSDRVLLTFGEALHPLEYAIINSPYDVLMNIVGGNLPRGLKEEARDFVEKVGKSIITGVYRASNTVPACVFYAHEEYAHQAALIALADSVLQEHRGFPLLLDLAQTLCRTTFGEEGFHSTIQQAYLDAGLPYRTQDIWDK